MRCKTTIMKHHFTVLNVTAAAGLDPVADLEVPLLPPVVAPGRSAAPAHATAHSDSGSAAARHEQGGQPVTSRHPLLASLASLLCSGECQQGSSLTAAAAAIHIAPDQLSHAHVHCKLCCFPACLLHSSGSVAKLVPMHPCSPAEISKAPSVRRQGTSDNASCSQAMPSCPVKFIGGCLQKGYLPPPASMACSRRASCSDSLPDCSLSPPTGKLAPAACKAMRSKQADPDCAAIVSCRSELACCGLFCPACRRGCHHRQVWHSHWAAATFPLGSSHAPTGQQPHRLSFLDG